MCLRVHSEPEISEWSDYYGPGESEEHNTVWTEFEAVQDRYDYLDAYGKVVLIKDIYNYLIISFVY